MIPPDPFAVTFFRDFTALNKDQRSLPINELAERIRETAAPEKGQLPWLKLARFGNSRTNKGSLRHDRNVIAISGIEADYDGEAMAFDQAVETVEKAGLLAILYTSPSHAPGRPRWRVVCPASREYPPKDRARLLGRLNGLYRGIFARESWTLSQAHYFGRVGDAAAHRVELVDGAAIDRLDELDRIWLGPPASDRPDARSAESGGAEARDDAELIRRIVTGEGLHTELCALAARYIGRGMDSSTTAEILRGLMLAHPDDAHDARWQDRITSIGAIVRSAAEKFAPEAERRRDIARLAHRLARRPDIPGDAIKSALIEEAERIGLSAGCAVAIGGGILREFELRHARRH